MIIGLLVLLRPSSSRGKHHTRGFVIAVCCVALIHPTGAIYLGMLMAAHLFIGLSIKEEYSENAKTRKTEDAKNGPLTEEAMQEGGTRNAGRRDKEARPRPRAAREAINARALY